MSYETKQLLNNINDEIEALKSEGILISAGGAALNEALGVLGEALGTSITNANTALSDAVGVINTAISGVSATISDEMIRTSSFEATLQTNVKYGFRITSTESSVVTIELNEVVNFNELDLTNGCFCIPNSSSYDLIYKRYTVPVDGYYEFSYRIFVASTNYVRISIKQDFIAGGTTQLCISGSRPDSSEYMSVIAFANAGDLIYVQVTLGSVEARISEKFGYFQGWKL
jgi:hypothetical protein